MGEGGRRRRDGRSGLGRGGHLEQHVFVKGAPLKLMEDTRALLLRTARQVAIHDEEAQAAVQAVSLSPQAPVLSHGSFAVRCREMGPGDSRWGTFSDGDRATFISEPWPDGAIAFGSMWASCTFRRTSRR